MMPWIYILAGVIILVPAVLLITGSLISPTHTATSSLTVPASRAEVWAAITGFESMPDWRPDVQRVERAPDIDGKPVWTQHTKFGPLPMAVEAAEEPERLVLRIADPSLPYGGTWTWVLAEAPGGGTTVTITEDGVISSAMFRVMARFVMGYHGTMDAYLRALAAKFGVPNARPEHG